VEICEQGRWDDSMVTQFVFWADVLVEQARGHEAEQALDRITRKRFEERTLEWPQFLHTRARSRWLHGDREAALDFFLLSEEGAAQNPLLVRARCSAADSHWLGRLGKRGCVRQVVAHRGWFRVRSMGGGGSLDSVARRTHVGIDKPSAAGDASGAFRRVRMRGAAPWE
jgi:hypothetical protein